MNAVQKFELDHVKGVPGWCLQTECFKQLLLTDLDVRNSKIKAFADSVSGEDTLPGLLVGLAVLLYLHREKESFSLSFYGH